MNKHRPRHIGDSIVDNDSAFVFVFNFFLSQALLWIFLGGDDVDDDDEMEISMFFIVLCVQGDNAIDNCNDVVPVSGGRVEPH
jgi:hypothetical protein